MGGGMFGNVRPFRFGVDKRIPESPADYVTPEDEMLYGDQAYYGGPPPVALTPGTPAPSTPEGMPQLPPVEYPEPPTIQKMGQRYPTGLRGILKHALMSAIPGYSQGYEGELALRQREIDQENALAQKVYTENMDRAAAEQRARNADTANWIRYQSIIHSEQQKQKELEQKIFESDRRLGMVQQQLDFNRNKTSIEFGQKLQNATQLLSAFPNLSQDQKDNLLWAMVAPAYLKMAQPSGFFKKVMDAERALGRPLGEVEILQMAGAKEAGPRYTPITDEDGSIVFVNPKNPTEPPIPTTLTKFGANKLSKEQMEPVSAAQAADTVVSEMYQAMEEAEQEKSAQADVLLLFRHMGMTIGKVKGARLNQAEIERAISARPWLGTLYAKFQAGVEGPFLTPEQRRQMISLAETMRRNYWRDAFRAGRASGQSLQPKTSTPIYRGGQQVRVQKFQALGTGVEPEKDMPGPGDSKLVNGVMQHYQPHPRLPAGWYVRATDANGKEGWELVVSK